MKKYLFTIMIFLLFSTSVSAHATVESTYPKHGSVIEDDLTEVTLTFDSAIESTGKVDIFDSEGTLVSVAELVIESPIMIVRMDQPLLTDDYNVDWLVIAEDGHTMEGSFQFSVTIPEIEVEEIVEEELVDEELTVVEDEKTVEEDATDEMIDTKEDESNLILPFVIFSLVFITAIAIFVKNRKK